MLWIESFGGKKKEGGLERGLKPLNGRPNATPRGRTASRHHKANYWGVPALDVVVHLGKEGRRAKKQGYDSCTVVDRSGKTEREEGEV